MVSKFRERLGFANQPSLRERLQALFCRRKQLVGVIAASIKNGEPHQKAVVDRFCCEFAKTRNALTHVESDVKGDFDGVDLFRLMCMARVVLVTCFLLDIGLNLREEGSPFASQEKYQWWWE